MVDWLTGFVESLTWRGLLFGVLIFVVTFVVNLAVVSFVLVKLPVDHFTNRYRTKFWSGRHLGLRVAGLIGKNLLGYLLVAIGILLSIPGVPGQGVLTILLGVMFIDFPGKQRLEQKLLSRPPVLQTINRLRRRFGKPALEIE